MGCSKSSVKSVQTNSTNLKENDKLLNDFKIIIWGAGGVGKSTIFRQIRYINNDQDENKEFQGIKPLIRENCLYSIQHLLDATGKSYDAVSNTEFSGDMLTIDSAGPDDCYLDNEETIKLGKSINNMWHLDIVKDTFNDCLKGKFFMNDNMDYFYNKIIEIFSKEWNPTKEDLFKTRKPTLCIVEQCHIVKQNKYKIFDIASPQRNRIRKWLNVWRNAGCIIFVIGLNDYSKFVYEDKTQNALLQSFKIFDQYSNSNHLSTVPLVLFLNKMDLFREHLKFTSLKFCFKNEYKGRNFEEIDYSFTTKIVSKLLAILIRTIEYDDFHLVIPLDIVDIIVLYFDIREEWLTLCVNNGVEFIKNKCLSICKDKDRKIDVYKGCALQSDDIETMMNNIYNLAM